MGTKDSYTDPLPEVLSTSPPPSNTRLKPASTFYPTNSKGGHIESFPSFLQNFKKSTKTYLKIILKNPEKLFLKNLMDNTDVIIKSADKGGGLVILNRGDFLKEA